MFINRGGWGLYLAGNFIIIFIPCCSQFFINCFQEFEFKFWIFQKCEIIKVWPWMCSAHSKRSELSLYGNSIHLNQQISSFSSQVAIIQNTHMCVWLLFCHLFDKCNVQTGFLSNNFLLLPQPLQINGHTNVERENIKRTLFPMIFFYCPNLCR